MNDLKYSIGIDLGGTNTWVALVDENGEIPVKKVFPTRDYPEIDDFVDKIAGIVGEYISEYSLSDNLVGIGIGAPCVNQRIGAISNATDLPWKGVVPLVRMVEEKTGVRTAMANDANAAAIGEMVYGAAKGLTDFVVLTLGTGVGGGVVCDGRLISGFNGFAGELGHVALSFASGRKCSCGRYGCLQTLCSSSGIVNTARHLLAQEAGKDSVLALLADEELTAKAIGEAAKKDDYVALETLRKTEEYLGKAFAEFASFTDPQAFVLFGGVARPDELNADHIKEVMEKEMLYIYRGKIQILFSALSGADAAIKGAASLPYTM